MCCQCEWNVQAFVYLLVFSSREPVLIEIADSYASHLWSSGLHEDAIAIWGRYVLPQANAEYWEAFVSKVHAVSVFGWLRIVVREQQRLTRWTGG